MFDIMQICYAAARYYSQSERRNCRVVMQMIQRAPASIFKMEEDDTLHGVHAHGKAEPEQHGEGDAMWPLKREDHLVELYRDAIELRPQPPGARERFFSWGGGAKVLIRLVDYKINPLTRLRQTAVQTVYRYPMALHHPHLIKPDSSRGMEHLKMMISI